MSANTNQIRCLVIKAYDSKDWAKKVSKMTDGQVTAIYLNLKKRGKVK